ncbi:GAF and ANTAR domain-containing protein [Rhodococcoides fascians]|uniref:GAF and ANTAR domain-containing protein n=1 Tax=Rhodococcoides fascians TaxID=1828 RepID=UPI000690C72A|nr:GAF and ANTAR domain-containing protein [Rhodococcus fascians]
MHNTTGGAPELTADQVLQEVTAGAVDFVPSADHAGVTLVTGHGPRAAVRSVAATGEVPRLLDALQDKFGAGPYLQSARDYETVHVADYRYETRWPAFTQAVLERTPVRSSLSIQLFTDREALGALNLYSETVDAFDDTAVDQAWALAAHAAVALSSARRSEQFRSALASRDIIGQAKGMIMERYTITARQAFALLSKLSQDSNIPIVELARRLADTERDDTAT